MSESTDALTMQQWAQIMDAFYTRYRTLPKGCAERNFRAQQIKDQRRAFRLIAKNLPYKSSN